MTCFLVSLFAREGNANRTFVVVISALALRVELLHDSHRLCR
ncbi:hypothetical protein BIFCAT_01727 [Bifidobacterium catenulatum DSM 16992 = JCM 1194 = LMG 11043]|uniref:Uncharacterized protein n=1 Tax=Bifidobacterium catenulatum DSM 16992 = JCM 1194 = LMG 11043 TaxID=566552 RepID=B6XWR4_9BIFI|nr:hypothetical protein BIFCAT_01727 [Bifidobacterium catenulatum DSM 16992 = JCM 1194 = LMG 11043]